MMQTMNVGDEYYEVSWTPPFEPVEIRLAQLLNVSLAGVCKIVVSFVRDPLDRSVLHAKSATARELSGGDPEPSLFECSDIDHI